MKKYLVRTHSVFEHIYAVEAESLDEAIQLVKDDAVNDWYQKHLGEEILECVRGEGISTDDIRKEGYF